jgi:ribose-phosphate pyrophosphokinase
LVKSVAALKEEGAGRVLAAAVHAVLSGPALERLESSPIEQVLVTNTTPLENKIAGCTKLRPFTVAPLLGEAIRRIHEQSSVSFLFV